MSAMAAIAERAKAVIRKIDKGEIVASEPVRRLLRMVAAVARHDEPYDALSSTERIAVALVLDRHDLLAKERNAILQAIRRVDPAWLQAQTVEQMVRGIAGQRGTDDGLANS
jgi:hypothetical protein